MFPTDESSFPIKKKFVFVTSCSVSPTLQKTHEAVTRFSAAQMERGISMFREFPDILGRVNRAVAGLLRVTAEDVSFVGNTANGISMIANGYPFEPGDEVISYAHEYPANHYPWRIQEQRGVKLKLVQDGGAGPANTGGRPHSFSLDAVEALITERTKVVALSHVQFTSGFAVELAPLGELCRSRGIDLVIDAAQSLGSLPIYPREMHIDAVASSGWKWLAGPIGSGILYSSPQFRKKIRPTMGGPELMKQGNDYLDLSWNPHESGRKFEYSTLPLALAEGLATSIEELFSGTTIEEVRKTIFGLQDIFLSALDRTNAVPLIFPDKNRSGILSLITRKSPTALCEELYNDGFIFTSRGGYFRVAPHCYLTPDEVTRAAEALNKRLA